jgi:D-alanine-D-alanine ligase
MSGCGFHVTAAFAARSRPRATSAALRPGLIGSRFSFATLFGRGEHDLPERAETLDVSSNLDSIGRDANQRSRRGATSMSKHVAVLMGGWSAEREVSLRSGRACAEALARQGYRVTRIDAGRDIAAVLTTVKPDIALNVLHGRPGEDGTLQGILEVLAIPYTHSGVLASAAAMQKDVAKVLFRAADVPVAEGLVASRLEAAERHLLPPPYVVKPVAEGSSVGVFLVAADHAHPPQELTRVDWPYGDRVIVEKYIPGKELTCAVMGEDALGVIEIVPTVRFYDYEAKYLPGGSKHLLPAPISPFVYQQVRRLALAAHRALGCRGVSRADFRYDDRAEGSGGLVCLEVNTQPGMTETSLVPELAAHAGMTFDELVRWMIEDASLNR